MRASGKAEEEEESKDSVDLIPSLSPTSNIILGSETEVEWEADKIMMEAEKRMKHKG